LKKGKRHILYAWIVMICFVAGQWAVYAHYHATRKYSASTSRDVQSRTTVSEKCQLCDAMHHNTMTQQTQSFFAPIASSDYIYKPGQYDFVSIALILSAGRAPPIS
jgi:hypothetical protein